VSFALIGRGQTLPEAFASAALTLFAQVVALDLVEPREVREVRAHGQTLEGLLVHWIGECRYVHEIEGFVCQRIEVLVFDAEPRGGPEPLRLHAILHGEEVDPSRHGPAGTMWGVAASGAAIEPVPGGFEVSVSWDA